MIRRRELIYYDQLLFNAMALNLLAEYEAAYDNDTSIYFFIRKNFSKSSFIDKNILMLNKIDQVRLSMLYNSSSNPLDIICVKGNDYTQLLNDILSSKDFYNFAYKYDICKMFHNYINADKSINVTILCRNKFQQKVVNVCDSEFNTIIVPKSKVDLSTYNILWVKYIDSLLQYKMQGNVIYLHQAMYNYEECEIGGLKSLMLHQKPLTNLYQNNEFRLVDPYKHLLFSPQEAL